MSDDQPTFSRQGCVYGDARYIAPLLGEIAAQALRADQTRSVSSELIAAIKRNDIMRLSASPELSGLDESIVAIGDELRAIAPNCGSTAWCLWNHLCTFHHFVGLLGPKNADFLRDVVSKREWFCFPAGASTEVVGVEGRGNTTLKGVAAFGSGGRYAEWAGVVFVSEGSASLRFALADLRHPKVRIQETWDGMSLRASATDHIHYDGVDVPTERVVPWPAKTESCFESPTTP
jgi:4-hydroxyphenylacetate 3-monooxygenase